MNEINVGHELNDVIRIDTNPFKSDSVVREVIETFELVDENSPILRKKLELFSFEKPPVDPNKFASSLVETCKKHGALGLSANQCGFEHRVFVMGSGDNYVAFFNPRILEVSEHTTKMEEGCLSYMDLFLNIERPASIRVQYQDFTGEVKEATFAGLTARCFQHEFDHMNGIVYTSHVKPLSLQMATKRRSKLKDKRKRIEKQMIKKVKESFNVRKF